MNKIIKRKDIQNYLYFVIYKLIKKLSYYKEFYQNEYLQENEDINSFTFQLFLIYDHKPFNNFNKYINECLQNLKKDNLLENEFILQALYVIPTMGTYNSRQLADTIDKNENEIEMLKENAAKKDVEIQQLKENAAIKDVEIQQLKENAALKDVEMQQLK